MDPFFPGPSSCNSTTYNRSGTKKASSPRKKEGLVPRCKLGRLERPRNKTMRPLAHRVIQRRKKKLRGKVGAFSKVMPGKYDERTGTGRGEERRS